MITVLPLELPQNFHKVLYKSNYQKGMCWVTSAVNIYFFQVLKNSYCFYFSFLEALLSLPESLKNMVMTSLKNMVMTRTAQLSFLYLTCR